MMTFKQFLEADEMEQIEAVWAGKLFAEHADELYRYEYFEVYGFFLEVKKNIEHGFIRSITPFQTKDEALNLWEN